VGGGGRGADSDPQHRRATRIPHAPPCHSCRAVHVPQSGRPAGAVSAACSGTRGGGGVANCRHNRGHGAPVSSGGVGRSASAPSTGLVAAARAGVESCGDGRAASGAGNGGRAGPAKGGEGPPLARPTVGAPHKTHTFRKAALGSMSAVATTAVVMTACRGGSVAAHRAVGADEASADVTTSALEAAAVRGGRSARAVTPSHTESEGTGNGGAAPAATAGKGGAAACPVCKKQPGGLKSPIDTEEGGGEAAPHACVGTPAVEQHGTGRPRPCGG